MKTLVRRWIAPLLAAAAALAAVLFAVGWVLTLGDYPVAPTVTGDPSLPAAEILGVRLHVETRGDPRHPTVVVIHGGPGNDFRYLLPLAALADRYHVVFYDQRGSGLSARVPDEALTLDALYAELDAIVDRYAGGRQVRLVGHSWGAMLAAGYLGRRPEKVAKAVLAEPGMLTPETAALLMEATNGMMPRASLALAWTGAKAFFRSLHVAGPDADARRDFLVWNLMTSDVPGHPTAGYYCGRDLSTARVEGWRFGARVGAALLGAARRADGRWDVDFTRGASAFQRKVLFLAGSCDAILGEAMQRRHMAAFPRAELVVIPGAGHTMFGEKPAESLAAVRRYLDEEG